MGIETALFIAAAGSAVSKYSAENKAAKATKAANQAAMQAAENEAALTKKDAEEAALEERREAARTRGAQIAAFLQSGVSLDGSPLLIANETTEKGKKNAQNIMETGQSKSDSILLKGKASQQAVQKPDIFGLGSSLLTAGQSAGYV